MNESITRAAGAAHGEELSVDIMEKLIQELGRVPKVRNTFYETVSPERIDTARRAKVLADITLDDSVKSMEKVRLIKPGVSLDPRDIQEAV